MDLMSEVIRTIRVGRASGRLVRHSGVRGIRFPHFDGSGFHVILHGTCWLITEDDDPVALGPGDVVLMTSGVAHGLNPVPCALRDLPPVTMDPGPGPVKLEFLCGGYEIERGHTPQQYLRTLPDLIVMPLDYDRDPEMRAVIDLFRANVSETQPGGGATLPALLDLILVHVLRQWHQQHDEAGWPNTDDPAIAAALREIHENPGRQWTVGKLSEAAGMPRTAFTRRFTTLVGQPPMSYLIMWRLGRGARLLRETDATLATIARQVGYSTEFAFSSAFRREYGVSPSSFRRTRPTVVCDA